MTRSPADAQFAEALSKHLPADTLRPSEPRHLEEPRGRWQGLAQFIARPRTVGEVSDIVRACAQSRVAIVPYAGGTGLVGGQMSAIDPVPLLLSVERMTAIREIFPQENAAIVEAGAILQDVQEAAANAGRLFPLSLASQGSARIGGLLATNAGGVNTLRYGNAREQVLGLEAVMPDGTVWNGLKRLRKDNTGYDLRNLLIGSEGTLGIITAASLKLSPRPAVTGTAIYIVRDPAAALALLTMARDQLGETVSAFEMMHRMGFDFLRETLPEVRQPWEQPPEWCVLMNVGLPKGADAQDGLEALFASALDAGLVSDGLIAQSEGQAKDFWNMREHIPEANRRIGSVSSQDISVPLGAIPEFIDRAGPALAKVGTFRINCFGHAGDGNLHYNVFPMPGETRADHHDKRAAVKTCLHDLAHSLGGSVSAEHGIGRLKVADLETYSDPTKLAVMRTIKSALDPRGIMNPGAVLREA